MPIYKNNLLNRQLNRVGQPYGKLLGGGNSSGNAGQPAKGAEVVFVAPFETPEQFSPSFKIPVLPEYKSDGIPNVNHLEYMQVGGTQHKVKQRTVGRGSSQSYSRRLRY